MNRISYVEEISKNLYLIQGSANGVFPYCHCYLFNDEVLIAFDPQCGRSRLKEGLQQLGKDFSDIDFIINSHFHADHTTANSFLKKRSGAKILIHEADRIAIEDLDAYVQRYGMTDKKIALRWRATLKMIGFKESISDKILSDGEILPGGFQVIHTPGHAPGHCCFLKSGILISGDIDLISPWVGNATSSVADYLESIEKLEKINIKMLLPGHGKPVFDKIPEKLEKFRQRFFSREVRILNALPNQPITLTQLTNRIFQGFPEEQRKKLEQRHAYFTFQFATINNLNYLLHLESQGKVQKITKNGQELWQKTG